MSGWKSKADFVRAVEAELQRMIDTTDKTIDLSLFFDIQNGSVQLKDGIGGRKDIGKDFFKGVPLSAGMVKQSMFNGKNSGNFTVKIESVIPGSSVPLEAALGRYFEYAVYQRLVDWVQMLGAEGTGDYPKPQLSFLFQQFAVRTATRYWKGNVDEVIRATETRCNLVADEAAKLAIEQFGDEIKKSLVVAAGAQTIGDIIAGKVVLELKYYKDVDNITYSSIKDFSKNKRGEIRADKGYGFSESFALLAQQTPTTWHIPSARGKGMAGAQVWYNAMMQDLFYDYANRNIPGEAMAKLVYLLKKGKNEVSLSNKYLIIGHKVAMAGDAVKAELTVSLQKMLDTFPDIGVRRTEEGAMEFYNAAGPTDSPLATFLLERGQFDTYTYNTKSSANREKAEKWKNGIVGTTLKFILHRQFFGAQPN